MENGPEIGAIGRLGSSSEHFVSLSQVAHHWSIQLPDLIKPNFKPISNQNQIQILLSKKSFYQKSKKKLASFSKKIQKRDIFSLGKFRLHRDFKMMNPGQKRSYPFSDDENLADQQVNP